MDFNGRHHTLIAIARSREAALIAFESDREKHHILPRSLGGSDDPENFVAMIYREHLAAHILLTKINSGSAGLSMQKALISLMKRSHNFLARNLSYRSRIRRRVTILVHQLRMIQLRDEVVHRKYILEEYIRLFGYSKPQRYE